MKGFKKLFSFKSRKQNKDFDSMPTVEKVIKEHGWIIDHTQPTIFEALGVSQEKEIEIEKFVTTKFEEESKVSGVIEAFIKEYTNANEWTAASIFLGRLLSIRDFKRAEDFHGIIMKSSKEMTKERVFSAKQIEEAKKHVEESDCSTCPKQEDCQIIRVSKMTISSEEDESIPYGLGSLTKKGEA